MLHPLHILHILLLASCCCVIVSGDGCPEGWAQTGASCYRASPAKQNWYQAQEDCWAQGGYLAEVTSAEEEAALNEVINPDLQYWIGLNDEEQEGSFLWAESQQVASYPCWLSAHRKLPSCSSSLR